MLKKIYILTVIFGITVLVTGVFLQGCRNQKSQEGLTFAVGGAPAELDFWQVLVKDFQQRTGIKVTLLRQPTDTDLRRQGLVTSLKSRQSNPDVFLMDVAWVAQFAASDWLEPLDQYMDKTQLRKGLFFEKVIDSSDTYAGKILALPVYVDGGLLYYRKDLLNEHGISEPPRTWQELVDYSVKIQNTQRTANPNFYGFVWQGAQYEGLVCNWLEVAGSNNGGIFIEDETIKIRTEENIAAAQFMFDVIHTYKISPPNTYTDLKEEQVRIFFQQGNALFERNWPYAWSLHQSQDSPVKDKVAIAALPHFPNGRSVSVLGGWHIGISRYSDARQQAFAFIEFVLSFDVQKRLALNLGWNPSRRDVYENKEVLAKLPYFSSLRQIFRDLRPRPSVPYYTLISEILQHNLNGVLSGKLTAADALTAAQAQCNEVIRQYGSP
jgi:multiple sugar transport system substrate-binding protein